MKEMSLKRYTLTDKELLKALSIKGKLLNVEYMFNTTLIEVEE